MSQYDRASESRSGRIESEQQFARQSVPGGVVVWEVLRERNPVTGTESVIGWELDHCEDITDADALGDWLSKHGHDRGHAYHGGVR
jgi:hypothetical protein